MSKIIDEVKGFMYEHEVVTASQIAIAHSINVRTVHNTIYSMNKDGLIKKIDVQEIGRGSKAVMLNPAAARQVADARSEAHLYREKDWENVPGSFLNILMANQFFCELIRVTKELPGNGVAEWIGRRSLAQKYQLEDPEDNTGKKKKDPQTWARMNGSCAFYYDNSKRNVHVDIYSGNETPPVMQDKLAGHLQALKAYWGKDVSDIILLLLYLGKRTGDRLLKIWQLLTDSDRNIPYLAVCNFETLAKSPGGVFAPVWLTAMNEQVSILQMPSQTADNLYEEELMGKKKRIAFAFKAIEGFGNTSFYVSSEPNNKDDNSSNKGVKENEDEQGLNGFDEQHTTLKNNESEDTKGISNNKDLQNSNEVGANKAIMNTENSRENSNSKDIASESTAYSKESIEDIGSKTSEKQVIQKVSAKGSEASELLGAPDKSNESDSTESGIALKW